ncbi:hypothetical protein HIM_06146 [Hirsutella minnesotensis 3608]|uniref:Uncharacterized protein n=1 Tax=Hirsutella minnesotensis 3608 TaxID=1043627 RepID=A0A0F7ZNY3_9HYPO|nr:hypothetical protein HIM_06146 [Hirsutella minnesotensis 3608]
MKQENSPLLVPCNGDAPSAPLPSEVDLATPTAQLIAFDDHDTLLQTRKPSASSELLSMLSDSEVEGPDEDDGAADAVSDAQASDSESDNDIDRYRLTPGSQDPRLPSVKKIRGEAAFQQWIQESQRSAPPLAADGMSRAIDRLSTARMIQSNEDKRIIASPREYQVELFEKAKEKNLIIVLDTGSGKTLIAALLLRHVLEQELEHRATGGPKKVAFFLVEKVALCFQQYSVLKANLEHPIAKFHGEMAGVMRTKDFWDKQLAENMVFVCTAQILLDCLNSGFISMSRINLLIFDEAHHTKKNHPYARIIKDHYVREPGVRPRVLGMTASPVDAQTSDLRAAATELENILCSEIATVSDEVLAASQAQRRQIEIKEYYDTLVRPEAARTPLWGQIANLLMEDSNYRAHFEATQDAASTLGPWCADRYWELLMTDAEVGKRTAKAQAEGSGFLTFDGAHEADRVLAAMQQAQRLIREYKPLKLSAQSEHYIMPLSAKLETLRQILQDAFVRQGTRRCIVFVQKRYTALLLADAFQQPGQRILGMLPAYIVGTQALSSSIANMSFRDQVLALQKFRRGDTNCLFATQVAEEGIDIPECDLIIRFDLYDSAIQYIQSKGRARQAQSTYISMLEQGNMQHLRRLKMATRDANALRRFCSALPADRKIQDVAEADLADNDKYTQKFYEVAETGARLTFASSLEVLAKFVASLSTTEAPLTPDYVVTYAYPRKRFTATVVMPDASPIKSKSGHAQRNKQLAKCSAAFEACVELIKKKYINGHLQPTLGRRLPTMRNARLALSSNKKESYPMRVKAEIWSQLGPPTELFQTVLFLDNPTAVGRPTSPVILLTRSPLPALDPTRLYFDNGRTSIARLASSTTALQLDQDQIKALTSFTLAVFTDVFSKEYDAEPQDVPYFLAPVRTGLDDNAAHQASAQIDWELLNLLSQTDGPNWRDASEDFFHDKLVMDPWDGSRKFIIHGINKCLKPSDPVPEGAPLPKSRAYRLSDQTIREYSNSLTIKSRRRQTWSEDQPVVNAELLPLRRNMLDEYSAQETQGMNCWLILEPLRVSKLPIGVVSMALIVPVMMYRLDSMLITLEACKLLDLDLRPALALEALTKDNSNTEEHDQEQIEFQVGMGANYERLEFLGDAFLKMATTISLFTLIPNSDEFEYHVERMLLVCNKNLFNHAVDRKIQEYVRSKSFDRRTWYPNMPLKKGKMLKTEVWHSLSDKSIADVCEAMIGAAFVSGADAGDMDLAVKAVTKMVRGKNHKMTRFSDYYQSYQMPPWQSAPASAAQRAAVESIYKTTGYRFQWPNLLRSAFKHPSYPYENVPNYQRLEFLGDSLLDLVIVDYLFRRFPEADPQWLTEHKMAMTSNHFFGCLCVQLGLHKHLLMTTSALVGQISDFVVADGEARRDFWLATSPPPKALSDMLEALVGALFVDSGYEYGAHAKGKTGRDAKMATAKAAVRRFDDLDRPAFAAALGCDCNEATGGAVEAVAETGDDEDGGARL